MSRALALATLGAATLAARDVRAEVHPWREICWLPAEDVSFAGIQVEGQGGAAAAHAARAQKARLGLEVNGLRGRLRVQMIAPFELTFTTENFALGSVSLRPGTVAGGLLQVLQPGVVRLAGISGDGRSIDVAAGSLMVRGLPLACEDLVAVQSQATWVAQAGTHRASDVPRLYGAASLTAASVAMGPAAELPVTVAGKPRGEWVRLTYAASAEGKAAFSVSGWARKPKLRAGGGAAANGAILASDGLRACAPTAPLAPREMLTTTLPAGTVLYESAQGEKIWAKLTSPVQAIVARYASGRAALAGLPGWTWPSWKCETAWLDGDIPEPGRDEAVLRAAPTATAAEARKPQTFPDAGTDPAEPPTSASPRAAPSRATPPPAAQPATMPPPPVQPAAASPAAASPTAPPRRGFSR